MESESKSVAGWDRRRFLGALGGASAAGIASPDAAADRLTTISVIHTTDLHGNVLPTQTYDGIPDVGGFARCASLIRRWRKENPDNLLIDIGDLYQGTHLSRQSSGRLMIDLLNRFGYDGWVLGNHEFDWGVDVVEDIVHRSAAPVLTGNVELGGRPAGTQPDSAHPFAKVAPWMIREIAGFKIGIAGLITPGLSYWLPPDLTRGVRALDPAPVALAAANELRELGADAVIVAGHMGTKFGRDDFANRVDEVLTKSVGKVDAYIAGHTHRDIASYRFQRALYTQAGYFGIYLGRVDLTFDRETRKLVDKRAFTVLMDDRFELDPVVLQLAEGEIEISQRALEKPIGKLSSPLGAEATPGSPSEISLLIGMAISEELASKRQQVDAVIHGQFLEDEVAAGDKTLADVWKIVPYENRVVTASLTPAELKVILEEMFATRYSDRNLMGLRVATSREGESWRVTSISQRDGGAIDPDQRLRVAFNSYDARSGGQRFLKLREILETPACETRLEPIETRSALAGLFANHGELSAPVVRDHFGIPPAAPQR